MTDITIPPGAELAALRAYVKEAEANGKLGACLRAACLAMIRNWEGMFETSTEDHSGIYRKIILPLPQEKQNEG